MGMTYKLINTIEQYEELLAITDLEERKNYFCYGYFSISPRKGLLRKIPPKMYKIQEGFS